MATNKQLKSENSKLFRCEICDKAFIKLVQLQKHESFHSQRTKICDICDKAFALQEDLKRHMRVHTGEKHSNVMIVRNVSAKVVL